MRAFSGTFLSALALLSALVLGAGAAEAKCKRMGFLVNDYGKDGPTKDAQELLDKHVAEWAAQNGVKNYTVGKKDVSCELFLNFIVFDEHTCTASANVCWDEPGAAPAEKTASEKAAPEKKKAAEKKSSEKKAAKAEAKTAEQPAEAAKPIETGTVTPNANPAAGPADDPDAAERAAVAAERAAAAAERAASAAEKAAAAANTPGDPPSQLEMPAFGAAKPADAAPATPDTGPAP